MGLDWDLSNGITMEAIAKAAGLLPEQFRNLI